MRIIFETPCKTYRIVEHEDQSATMEDLKGDCFSPAANPDIDPFHLKAEEQHFEDLVNHEGVFGYVLEKWNSEPSKGYEHVNSCWGFVGQYSESDKTFNHYIVDELKSQINTNKVKGA